MTSLTKVEQVILDTELRRATGRNQLETMRAALLRGARVNQSNNFKETPLELSAQTGHVAGLSLLLEAGADIELQGTKGRTALGQASNYGRAEVVQILLQRGANTEAPDNYGYTPLMLAVEATGNDLAQLAAKNPSIVEYLVKRRASSCLCLQYLLEAGANMDATTITGFTIFDLAKSSQDTETLNALMTFKAAKEVKTGIQRTPTAAPVVRPESAKKNRLDLF